jgi:outer membrane cobalamin receptor
LIRRTDEGIVVDASQTLTQIGGTAADLLRNMPGVLVGSEGGVSLRGRSPLILINGRISGISGTDRSVNLQQIPASSIERIEIITNPSAKYDADAEGGIINIVLEKKCGLVNQRKLDTRACMFTFGYTFKSAFKEKLMENKFKNQ